MDSNDASVVFTEKAYLGIIAETYENVGTETGGIFLGKHYQGKWYILETLDPGPKSIFHPTYFEYDVPYVNHLANKIARFYSNSLELVGLWHRHPGSFSKFSSTDDSTNMEYARICVHGAISALVNLDPGFRLTIYHVSQPLNYTELSYLVDTSSIPQEIRQIKTNSDFFPRVTSSQRIRPVATRVGIGSKQPQSNSLVNNSPKKNLSLFNHLFHCLCRKKAGERYQSIRTHDDDSINTEVVTRKLLLDMIDTEIEYINSQCDYECSQRFISNSKFLIVMRYVNRMQSYPKILELIFSLDGNQQVFVEIGNDRRPYKPGFINRYLTYLINQG